MNLFIFVHGVPDRDLLAIQAAVSRQQRPYFRVGKSAWAVSDTSMPRIQWKNLVEDTILRHDYYTYVIVIELEDGAWSAAGPEYLLSELKRLW